MQVVAWSRIDLEGFVRDRDIAKLLGMSASWVRQQRFRRIHGLPHVLDIDPCFFGKSARYRAADIRAWIERIIARKAA